MNPSINSGLGRSWGASTGSAVIASVPLWGGGGGVFIAGEALPVLGAGVIRELSVHSA